MNCHKCKQEFTAEDDAQGNYRKGFGSYSHRLCPNTTCFVCDGIISNLDDATQSMALVWRHKGCKPDLAEAKRRIAAEPIEEVTGESLFAKI